MRHRNINRELIAKSHQTDPYHTLCYAIITQAVNDLIESIFTIMVTDQPGEGSSDKRRADRRKAERCKAEAETFFRSEWYDFMTDVIGFSGGVEWLIQMSERRAREHLVQWMTLRGKQQTNYYGTHKIH